MKRTITMTSSITSKLEYKMVREASNRLKNVVKRTPIMESSYFNNETGCNIYFKCENFQRTGAFKFRGAYNAMHLLPDSIRSVVTHSSGNHGSALTKAAILSGREVTVVMPNNAPKIKQNVVKGYGGNIVFCEPTLKAREEATDKIINETGAVLIHPNQDENVIYGQGTIGMELIEDISDLQCILVPIGGGGMIAGIALSAMNFNDRQISIIGCEPYGADYAYQSKESGQIVGQSAPPNTIADGLRTPLGETTFPIVYNSVEQIFRVTEEQIISAIRDVYERMKIVIEPSAGVGVAVLMQPEFKQYAKEHNLKHVGVILCGGNVDLDALKSLF